jgi:ribosomal protein L20A (L18A)
MYQRLTINGVAVIEQGINGTVVWEKYSSGNLRILEGEEKAIVQVYSVMESNQKEYFSKIEIAGVVEIQGQHCIKLLMIPEGGGTHARFFSNKTGLMVAAFYAFEHPSEGPVLTKLFLDNYKEIDRILLPHFIEIESTVSSILGNRTSKARFKVNYEHNLEIPEERFELP